MQSLRGAQVAAPELGRAGDTPLAQQHRALRSPRSGPQEDGLPLPLQDGDSHPRVGGGQHCPGPVLVSPVAVPSGIRPLFESWFRLPQRCAAPLGTVVLPETCHHVPEDSSVIGKLPACSAERQGCVCCSLAASAPSQLRPGTRLRASNAARRFADCSRQEVPPSSNSAVGQK